MVKKVSKVITEVRTVRRAILECGHMYSSPIPMGRPIKVAYICYSCKNQKDREELGFKPQVNKRKNK